jgi:hypothetical protein
MGTTLNHLVLSRAQLAEASELAEAGSTALAREHLLFAADHALLAHAAHSAIEHPHDRSDRFAVAVCLADVGAAPEHLAPVLRDLDDRGTDYMRDPPPAARLDAGFGLVQALIDSYLARPVDTVPPQSPAPLPYYGGPRGAMNARGAEAAARGLSRTAAAVRRAVPR